MPRTIEVEPSGRGLRVGIAVARFNQAVTSQLLEGALAALRERGVADDAVDVVMVPGAFELPLCVQRLAGSGRTVLVSSHDLSELEQVCDWLILIDAGRSLYQGPTRALLDDAVTGLVVAGRMGADQQHEVRK